MSETSSALQTGGLRSSISRLRHGSTRMSTVLKSGILARRGKMLDLIHNNSSLHSRTLLELNAEDQKLLDLFNLDFFNSSLFATVLEDTLTELKILGECNSQIHTMKTKADMAEMRAAKYGVVPLAVDDELKGIERKQLGREEYKLRKLAADRQLLHDTIFVTYVDLSLNNSFESLAQQLAVFYERDAYRATLAAEETDHITIRRDLARQLRLQRNHIRSANYDSDVVIDRLKAVVEDSNINAEARSRYTSRWQLARAEQHEAAMHEAEAWPLQSIVRHKHKLDGENRIHSEVMMLINMMINDTMDRVEKAMARYDSHMEDIDLQIQIMKNKHQDQVDIRRGMQEKYKKHEKDVNNWLAFKEVRVDAGLYREKMMQAALVVQAWWRGMMVRLQLGPYRARKTSWRPKKN